MRVFSKDANQDGRPFILPDLPYAKDAMVPHITPEAFDYHHGKHHQAYVNKLNQLIVDTALAENSLEEIIISSHKNSKQTGIFNNAAQIWNHSFFWHSMKKRRRG